MKDGETTTAPVEKAELLNKQFSSVFTSEDTDSVPKITQKKYTNIGRIDVDVDVDDVVKLLTNLNASKAAGPDQLGGRLLKATARESAEILQVIFQRSIDEEVLPGDWKKALITPVYKKKRVEVTQQTIDRSA